MADKQDPGASMQSREEALADFKRSLTDELDRIFDEAAIQARKEGRAPEPRELPKVEVRNYGRLSSITLPPGWTEFPPDPPPSGRQKLREFRPAADSHVKIRFFFRGHPLTPDAAATFRKVLDEKPHFLLPSAVKSLEEVVGEQSDKDSFKLLVAATRDMGSNRVIVIEGRRLEDDRDEYSLYIDADGSGGLVQEIHFTAPRDDYTSHFADAIATFKSIQWR